MEAGWEANSHAQALFRIPGRGRDCVAGWCSDRPQTVPRTVKSQSFQRWGDDGAPGTIRTSDPQIRSLMLYPAELRARNDASLVRHVAERKPVAPKTLYG